MEWAFIIIITFLFFFAIICCSGEMGTVLIEIFLAYETITIMHF